MGEHGPLLGQGVPAGFRAQRLQAKAFQAPDRPAGSPTTGQQRRIDACKGVGPTHTSCTVPDPLARIRRDTSKDVKLQLSTHCTARQLP